MEKLLKSYKILKYINIMIIKKNNGYKQILINFRVINNKYILRIMINI
jgi:hypothetical protein